MTFAPRVFNDALIPDRATCKQLLQKNSVQLRGWDYPHIPQGNMDHQKIYFGADHCEAFIDWGNHKEVLRYYQSGLFVHYVAVHEDWLKEDKLSEIVGGKDPYTNTQPGTVLSFVNTTYLLTEVYEFLRRLAAGSDVYESGVKVEIKLVGTYQIDDELNTRYKSDNDEWIYDYPELNTAINSLKIKLAKYYETTTQPKLFEYELLK